MRLLKIMSLVLALFSVSAASSETRLMMIEEHGCPWCERWHEEVGDVYAFTEEGLAAPLRLHDISDRIPEGVTLHSFPQYTPTFILLVDGVEVNRIEGYPGESFFWGLLNMMLEDIAFMEGD